jgi:hypothetical protein
VQAAIVWIIVLSASVAGYAPDQQPARTFSVQQAKTEFRAQTGLPLVNFRAASTPEVTSLRTRPYQTPRFGNFQLFVLHPRKIERMRRVFTNGVAPDEQGIHWVSDRMGGWIAVTVFERNLVLAWFTRSRDTDTSWLRLMRAVKRLAPQRTLRPRG